MCWFRRRPGRGPRHGGLRHPAAVEVCNEIDDDCDTAIDDDAITEYSWGTFDRLATLDLADCDFGTPTGGDDNTPDDLVVYLDFDCASSADDTCVPEESTAVTELDEDVTDCLGPACP